MRSVVLGALSGLLLVLAFPPWGWAFVAPLAIGTFLWAVIDTRRPSEAWFTGWGFGILFFAFLFPWLGELVEPAVIALGPLVVVQAAFTAVYARFPFVEGEMATDEHR